jgi:Family of unknown function (DUF6361)
MNQSTFTWLAYSEREQRQAHDLASSLSERETRDELGVGSIRDAIANRLFPGTSTIQSRARYFLFLPWLFQALERDPRGRARERTDLVERMLIGALRSSDDTRGLVGGQTARVERLPSSVYWGGLGTLGIRRVPRSLSAYHRWLDDPRRGSRVARDDDGVAIEGVVQTWWDRVPPAPPDFPEVATFALSSADSSYLTDKAVRATPYPTLLAFLFDGGRPDAVAAFPWEHPQRSAMPPVIGDDLDVAENFSLIHYGAALLYNQLIAEAREDPVRTDQYRADVAAWQTASTSAIADFDLQRVRQLAPKASPLAMRFIQDWQRTVRAASGRQLADHKAARELVTSREIRVKGRQRSRIAAPLRVEWAGASGSSRLDYRWRSSVERIALDVAEGRSRA